MDLSNGEALILSIIPFKQIAIDFGCSPESGKLTCPSRALQRAGKNFSEIQSRQSLPERSGILLATLR